MGKQFDYTTCNNDACRTTARVPFYQAAYQSFNASYYNGGPMQGIMFWRLVNGPIQDNGDGLGVAYTDALFTGTILPNSKSALQFATSKNAANCTPTVRLRSQIRLECCCTASCSHCCMMSAYGPMVMS